MKNLTLTVSLTDKHIKEGVALSCGYCPVSLAVEEAVTKYFNVPIIISTTYKKIDILFVNDIDYESQKIGVALTNFELETFIFNFDNDDLEFCKPITWIERFFDIPEQYLSNLGMEIARESL